MEYLIDRAVTEKNDIVELKPIPYSTFDHGGPVELRDIIFINRKYLPIIPKNPSVNVFIPSITAFLVVDIRRDRISIRI